jgi:flagellar M-ring protein FliF
VVSTAIGLPEGQTGIKPRVTVNSFALLPPPQPLAPPVTDKTLGWLSRNWTTVALLGLVGFGLVMLRSMVKAVPLPQLAPQPIVASQADRPEPAAEATRRAIRREPVTESLRDELTSMVREDPETAASVIRGWIGSPG